MSRKADADWEAATWDGSRRAQLRAALALTVRERLEALEALAELARRLAEMPRSGPDASDSPKRNQRFRDYVRKKRRR
jgi:hypothetical protein